MPVPSDQAIVEPRGYAGSAAARRRCPGEREHRHRARDALGQQVADRAGGLASEQDRAADHERVPARVRHVQQREQNAAIHQQTALMAAKRSGWRRATSRSAAVGGPPRRSHSCTGRLARVL